MACVRVCEVYDRVGDQYLITDTQCSVVLNISDYM